MRKKERKRQREKRNKLCHSLSTFTLFSCKSFHSSRLVSSRFILFSSLLFTVHPSHGIALLFTRVQCTMDTLNCPLDRLLFLFCFFLTLGQPVHCLLYVSVFLFSIWFNIDVTLRFTWSIASNIPTKHCSLLSKTNFIHAHLIIDRCLLCLYFPSIHQSINNTSCTHTRTQSYSDLFFLALASLFLCFRWICSSSQHLVNHFWHPL